MIRQEVADLMKLEVDGVFLHNDCALFYYYDDNICTSNDNLEDEEVLQASA